MTALPLPESLFRVYLLCARDCLLLHILWDLALSVCLSCTALGRYFNTNALVWTAALPPQKEGSAGVGSSFWPPLKGNELLLEQLYHVLLLLLLACTLSLDCGSLHIKHPIQCLYRNTREVSHQANKQITRDSPGQTPDKGSETQWHPHSFFLPCKINQTYTLNRQVA